MTTWQGTKVLTSVIAAGDISHWLTYILQDYLTGTGVWAHEIYRHISHTNLSRNRDGTNQSPDERQQNCYSRQIMQNRSSWLKLLPALRVTLFVCGKTLNSIVTSRKHTLWHHIDWLSTKVVQWLKSIKRVFLSPSNWLSLVNNHIKYISFLPSKVQDT